MTENTPTSSPVSGDDFAGLALLAGLTGSNTHQIKLLKIITNPALSEGRMEGETPTEIAAQYEDFGGYEGFDYNSEVQRVADFLYSHYAARDDLPDFSFGFDCNSDGEIGGYLVSATIGTTWDDRLVLVTWSEIKHSTMDREATGLKAAIAVAETLDNDFHSLVAKARQRGLLTAAPNVVEDAARCLSDYDAVPTNEDVDVDVLAGLRDSLAALLSAQGTHVTATAPGCANPGPGCVEHDGTCD